MVALSSFLQLDTFSPVNCGLLPPGSPENHAFVQKLKSDHIRTAAPFSRLLSPLKQVWVSQPGVSYDLRPQTLTRKLHVCLRAGHPPTRDSTPGRMMVVDN